MITVYRRTGRTRGHKAVMTTLVAVAVLVAACGGNGSASDAGEAAANAPKLDASAIDWITGGDSSVEDAENVVADATLRVRFYDEPSGFDPATIFRIESENIAFNVYSGLVTYDGVTGEIIPDLATEWSNIDNRVWTFKL